MLYKRIARAFVLSGLLAAPALALDNGAYSGEADYGGTLDLVVKGKNVRIDLGMPGCQGDAEGTLRPKGKGLWTMRPAIDPLPGFPACVIEFRQQGNSIKINEGRGCMVAHGARCTFDGTVKPAS